MKRKASMPGLKRKLDDLFSRYVRMSEADDNGMAACVTCGKYARWQDMDAGHFVPRACLSTRWDEMNVHAQCRHCNRFRTDMYADYALYMVDRYGRDRVANLRAAKHKPVKLSRGDLETRIDEVSTQLAALATGAVREPAGRRYALDELS